LTNYYYINNYNDANHNRILDRWAMDTAILL